jgi:hypothetical protein
MVIGWFGAAAHRVCTFKHGVVSILKTWSRLAQSHVIEGRDWTSDSLIRTRHRLNIRGRWSHSWPVAAETSHCSIPRDYPLCSMLSKPLCLMPFRFLTLLNVAKIAASLNTIQIRLNLIVQLNWCQCEADQSVKNCWNITFPKELYMVRSYRVSQKSLSEFLSDHHWSIRLIE